MSLDFNTVVGLLSSDTEVVVSCARCRGNTSYLDGIEFLDAGGDVTEGTPPTMSCPEHDEVFALEAHRDGNKLLLITDYVVSS
jgi:hypothetical protein